MVSKHTCKPFLQITRAKYGNKMYKLKYVTLDGKTGKKVMTLARVR